MTDATRQCKCEHWQFCQACKPEIYHSDESRKSAPTKCAWAAWLANEATRTDQAAAQLCCGEYDACDRPCTPRGRYLADKDARIGTYNETDVKPKETPRRFPKRFNLNGNKLTLSLEFSGPIGVAMIYSRSGELICACWPFVIRLTWGY